MHYKTLYKQFDKCKKLGIHEEGQNDISYNHSESIAVVSSSSFVEKSLKKGHEVLHVVDPAVEFVVQQPKNFM